MDKYVELTQKVQNTKLNLSTPPLLVFEYSFATSTHIRFYETDAQG
jgi:hypothetical protein